MFYPLSSRLPLFFIFILIWNGTVKGHKVTRLWPEGFHGIPKIFPLQWHRLNLSRRAVSNQRRFIRQSRGLFWWCKVPSGALARWRSAEEAGGELDFAWIDAPKWWSLGYLLFGRPCYEVQFIRKINVLWSSWGLLGALEAPTKWWGIFFLHFFYFLQFSLSYIIWIVIPYSQQGRDRACFPENSAEAVLLQRQLCLEDAWKGARRAHIQGCTHKQRLCVCIITV